MRKQIQTHGRNWDVLSEHREEGQYPVYLMRCKSTLAVQYGAEFHTYPMYEDLAAVREFGYCIRHALECNGRLDK